MPLTDIEEDLISLKLYCVEKFLSKDPKSLSSSDASKVFSEEPSVG